MNRKGEGTLSVKEGASSFLESVGDPKVTFGSWCLEFVPQEDKKIIQKKRFCRRRLRGERSSEGHGTWSDLEVGD